MATERTPTSYRALLIPDSRITYAGSYDAATSSHTSAGPTPGVPVATTSTDMVLTTSGDKYTPGTAGDLVVRAQEGGHPSPSGAAYIWKYSTDADTKWRGWEPPVAVSAWEALDYTTTAGKWKHPHAVTLPDGTVLVAVVKTDQYIRVWKRNPQTDAWTEYAVADHGSAYAFSGHPCLVTLPSGRVLCLYWVESGASNQVRMIYSDDQGATWTQGQRACLSEAIDTGTYKPDRLRAAYLNGSIVLVAWVTDAALTFDDILIQYASSDLGCNFAQIDMWTGADIDSHAAYPDLAVLNSKVILGYLRESAPASGKGTPYVRMIGSAYALLSDAEPISAQIASNPMRWGDKAAGVFTAGEYALWADEDGTLYQAGSDFAGGAARECYVHRSGDGGYIWLDMGGGSAPGAGASWWNGQDTSTHPAGMCATAQGGRQLVVHGFQANPGTGDPSLCVAYLGGYSSVILPPLSEISEPNERVGFERVYLPYDMPEDTGGIWTPTTVGAPVTTLDTATGCLKVVAGAGDEQYWTTTTTPPGTLGEGIIHEFSVKVDGAITDQVCFSRVRIGDGATISYEVEVWVGKDYIRLRDLKTGGDVALISTTVGVDGYGVEVLLSLRCESAVPANNGKVKAYYRAAGTSPDRKWLVFGSSATINSDAPATSRIQWGMRALSGTSWWRKVAYVSDQYTGLQLYDQTNPHDLLGRQFASSPAWLVDGVKLQAIDGPAYRGDEWTVGTRYEYGIEHAHTEVSPSPRRAWRSLSDTVDQYIVWKVQATDANPFLSKSIGLYLGSINFRDYSLYGMDSTGAWILIGTGNAAQGQQGLKFVRHGDTILPDLTQATSAEDYFPFGILTGSYFKSTSTIAGNPVVVRPIAVNSEGAWSGDVVTKRTSIQLADWSALDEASGVDGEIWSKDSLLVRNGVGDYRQYKLKIPAQVTSEGYFTIGTAVLGHIAFLSWPYDWGRSQVWTPNYELTTGRSGSRRARKLGPTRRRVEVAWTEGVDTSEMWSTAPAPDYVAAYTGGAPVGAMADTPYLVTGLLEYLAGATVPVVYIARLDRQASAAVDIQIPSRSNMLYGRIVSQETSIDTVIGDELASPRGELVRVSKVAIEEEV